MTRSTHTYAILRVSPEAYEEVRAKLVAHGYQDQFHRGADGEVIDMHGLALQSKSADAAKAGNIAAMVEAFSTLGLLLGCLRNFQHTGAKVDLDGALGLVPEVQAWSEKIRDMLPRPE